MVVQVKIRFYALLLALPLLHVLLGCSTNPATGNKSFTAFMSPDDEIRVGAEEHPKLLKEFGMPFSDNQIDKKQGC